MKWTPQKAIDSASVAAARRERPSAITAVICHVLDLGQLVVVGEDQRLALRRERPDLPLSELSAAGGSVSAISGLDRRELLHAPFLS